MNVFFDTSSLFKLYHKESGTEKLLEFFDNNTINKIYLAEISRIEFSSTVWKKCRKHEIGEKVAKVVIDRFKKDSSKFTFITDSSDLKSLACELIEKYWSIGLRTLDSIQLASGLSIKEEIDYFFTSDTILKKVSESEGFKDK